MFVNSLVFSVGVLWAATLVAETPQELATKALNQTPATCSDVTSSRDCHSKFPAGCEPKQQPGYDAYLNYFKNQLTPTNSQPSEDLNPAKLQGLEAGTPTGLKENNHRTFSSKFVALKEGEIVQATGFLYYVQQTGAESCNCERAGAEDSDYHIGLGFNSSLVSIAQGKPAEDSPQFHKLQVNSMVVEITPQYRAQLEPSWTLDKLMALYGKQIKVVGQLIADNDHYGKTQDCGIKGADPTQCWRMSIWEIHPVTALYVCTTSGSCAENDAGWVKLEVWNP